MAGITPCFKSGYYGTCKIKIVSGQPQRLQIHYEAVLAERIEYEMIIF